MAKLVLITGAAKRVGKELALSYARAGWHVAVHHYKSIEEAIELQSQAKSFGAKVSLFQADLRERASAEDLFSRVVKECGIPQLLINNAAVFEQDETPIKEDTFGGAMTVNCFTPIRLTQALHAKAVEPVTSVILGDATLDVCWKNFYSYAMSKTAMHDWVQAQAKTLQPKLHLRELLLGPTLRHERESETHFNALVAASKSGQPTKVEKIVQTIDKLVENPGDNTVIDLS
jgi:NAD(P)-dependent dehydrogenase (short-subunit alcohol dehydrogenase family)